MDSAQLPYQHGDRVTEDYPGGESFFIRRIDRTSMLGAALCIVAKASGSIYYTRFARVRDLRSWDPSDSWDAWGEADHG